MARVPTTPTDTLHCAVRLRETVSALNRQLRESQSGGGLSVAKLSALGHLYRSGALTPTELAHIERVKLQSLTRLLAELEADGWIARMPSPDDGRQSVLSMTKSGIRRLTADVHRREASLLLAIETQLSGDDCRLLLDACTLIDRICDALPPGLAPATLDPSHGRLR